MDSGTPLAQAFLPVFDVSDTVACSVSAGPADSWAALLDVDLIALGRQRPAVGVLGAARLVPELVSHLVHRHGLPDRPDSLTLRDMASGGSGAKGDWTLLAERDNELALGLVGRFWKPVIEYEPVAAEEFASFAEPGWAKTVYCLAAEALTGGGTQLRGTMRTATTDHVARRKFRRYWTFGVGAGAHVLVTALLETASDGAEQMQHSSVSLP